MNSLTRSLPKGWILSLVLVLTLLVGACRPVAMPTPALPPKSSTSELLSLSAHLDSSLPPQERARHLLAYLSLEEKIGQMTLVEKNSITPDEVRAYYIGAVLSGGGGYPPKNTPEGWAEMTRAFQEAALQTPHAIPLLYGADGVHGHGNLYGATIFPHNIGLGAANDPELVEKIARATAEEMRATGVHWNYAPVIAVPQDLRWGRTYEAFSENTEIVARLGAAYVRGLQGDDPNALFLLATPKHFIGDGGTTWGTSTTSGYFLDQGDTVMDEAHLRALFLPPYQAAIQAGAQSIMLSFSSWNGTKMHAHRYLITDVLKGELGFSGFVVSDWGGIDQISPDYYTSVVTAINAGIDMNMVPYDFRRFQQVMKQAVEKGDIPLARIDDAVLRILTVKFRLGLFEQPFADETYRASIGSPEHRALAREAVAKSLVLLKNEGPTLPLAKNTKRIFIAGAFADDIGAQCGGWTIEWQGKLGNITPGTTIRQAIEAVAEGEVVYNRFGKFENLGRADVAIVVVGEAPYAEGRGDRLNPALSENDLELIRRVRPQADRIVLLLISGRPIIITEALPLVDAVVAAWLPGTEGRGVADVLFGDRPFTGVLPFSWPRTAEQLPFDFQNLPKEGCAAPLFPFGYGLGLSSEASMPLPPCP